MIDLLEKEPTPTGAFAALVAVVQPVIAFDSVAIAHNGTDDVLVACAAGFEALRPRAIAVAESARRYFAGDGTLDDYVSLTARTAQSWICLPLSNDGVQVLGVVSLGRSAVLGEDALAFLACVARHCARALAAADRGRSLPDRGPMTIVGKLAGAIAPDDARAMLRERDEMLTTVSHDLQNPLGVILMSAALLLKSMPLDDPRRAGRGHVEAIHRNARRMKRLVTDLLDFDSIEAGRMAMTPRAVHPLTLIAAAIEDTTLAADAVGVTLRRGILGRLPLVFADPDRMLQVLLNLLTNAVKFTPRGGVIIVGARASETKVTFSVQDSGIGISSEELPHVFERHWQAPSSGAVRKQGSGLGLAICKSLIELSHGRIWAHSRCGHGTTMSFSLPIATGDGLCPPRRV